MDHSIKDTSLEDEFPVTLKPTVSHGQPVLSLNFDNAEQKENKEPDKKIESLDSLKNLTSEQESTNFLMKDSAFLVENLPLAQQTPTNFRSNVEDPLDNLKPIEQPHPLQKVASNPQFTSEGELGEPKLRHARKSAFPRLSLKMSEEIKRDNSLDSAGLKPEAKEPKSAEVKPKDDNGASFFSDIVISKKRGTDDSKKTRRGLLASKPVTISLTFDAFMDQVKGRELTAIASNYPDYKIDKRLIFLGKEVDYPWHIISYHSTFRKLWNLFIIALITYEIFWYPVIVTFAFGDPWPLGALIFEIISIFIFLADIIINIRTTYSNENNEEIIDSKMMRNNYIKTKLFKIDVITTLPIPEILLLILIGSEKQWIVYSLVILVRMLRVFKIPVYLQNRTLNVFMKLIRIFVTFFIVVHWVSCIWYIMIKAEYSEDYSLEKIWFPNNLRMIATGDEDLIAYYQTMDTVKVYGFTLLSVFMLAVGSDMAPATNLQIWFSVMIGLFGAVSIAYIFGLVTLIINRANQESSLYQQQLEELKHKLRINKIPHNLKVKVMEYFYYSWRKHSVLKKMDDFSELSIPLQRDIALYQHQEMLIKVPLFKELDPIEILSIIQKLKTSIYMPGDKIIREGERGNEMYFIQEGVVERLMKRPIIEGQTRGATKFKYDKTFLEKGAYFGEVALMSNSKRTFDVNAYEFCILYTFSRTDYENLKNEFRDIGPRLRSGLKHYKNTHMGLLIQILKKLDIFKGFTNDELQRIGDEYLEELFVDPDRVIIDPKERINAIYIIVGGNINCYADNEETRNYLNNLKRSHNKDNWTVVDVDEEEDIECLDDDILNLEKDKISMEDQKKKLDLDRIYTYGDYFGTLDFDVNEIKCDKFYVSDTGCQIGAITQALKSQMANEDPILYEKLKQNVILYSPKRVMVPIEEESDSSFTTKNNTLLKTKLSRRTSNISDFGKKPILFKTTSLFQNKKDDIVAIKDELQQLEEEMNTFKSLVSETNSRLNKMFPVSHTAPKSDDGSPDKSKSKGVGHFFAPPKLGLALNRNPSNMLLGVDEEENMEESQHQNNDEK